MSYYCDTAYEAAVRRNIRRNIAKGYAKRSAEWQAANSDWEKIVEFCNKRALWNSFYRSLNDKYSEYGSYSEKQMEIIRRDMVEDAAKQAKRQVERAEANKADAAASAHVGTIGERTNFVLTFRRAVQVETRFGTMGINIFNDDAGNVFVYMGAVLSAKAGDVLKCKATIKNHDERDGVKQTILSRPKWED